MKTHKGWYSFPVSFNFGITWSWIFNATPRPLYPGDRDPAPRVGLHKCTKSHPHRPVPTAPSRPTFLPFPSFRNQNCPACSTVSQVMCIATSGLSQVIARF